MFFLIIKLKKKNTYEIDTNILLYRNNYSFRDWCNLAKFWWEWNNNKRVNDFLAHRQDTIFDSKLKKKKDKWSKKSILMSS